MLIVFGVYACNFGWGGAKFSCWCFFSRGNFPWGGKFPGSEIVRVNYTLQEFAKIFMQNPFYMSCFLFSVSILRADWLKLIVLGKFFLGLNCLERGFFNYGSRPHLGSRSKIMGSRVIKIQFNKKCFLTCKIIVIKKNNNHCR